MKKKLSLYLMTMILIAIPMLQSCDDDDHSLGDFIVTMATVRIVSGETYYLQTDNGKKLWPAATGIPWYKPIGGQRVWADFTLLSDKIPETEYDHAIKVNYLFNVLTKPVDKLTAENEEEIGNDPAYIEEMWIGGNYLNVQFLINIPVNKLHQVSLVENTLTGKPIIDKEGYVHLEYRFHKAKEVYSNVRRSYVSFNLGEYGPIPLANNAIKGLKVKINSIKNGEKDIVFKFAKDNTEKTITLAGDVVNEGTK